jgi:hypothetical protein
MEIYLGVFIALVILCMVVGTHQPYQIIQVKPKTLQDELDELEANRKLRENYRFVKPRYAGFYMGEKIKKGDPRVPKLLEDEKFLRDTGKWVPKDKK